MGARVPERALSRHDGVTSFSTLTTIGESPLDAKVLYTGSDDGRLMVTRDGGEKWTDLNERIPGLPAGTYVSSVLPSRHVAGRVYATFDGHYNDDYRAYVYVSDDYGQTWRSIAAGPAGRVGAPLREHPRNARLLFVGHERGIHFSIDGGASWSPLTLNMPTVPVDDILIHPRDNDLIAGTHGRSIWVLDNISSLEALTPDAMRSDAFLVPPARARLLAIYNPQAWYGAGQFFAPNPDVRRGDRLLPPRRFRRTGPRHHQRRARRHGAHAQRHQPCRPESCVVGSAHGAAGARRCRATCRRPADLAARRRARWCCRASTASPSMPRGDLLKGELRVDGDLGSPSPTPTAASGRPRC